MGETATSFLLVLDLKFREGEVSVVTESLPVFLFESQVRACADVGHNPIN
jgi:hypothetical protein